MPFVTPVHSRSIVSLKGEPEQFITYLLNQTHSHSIVQCRKFKSVKVAQHKPLISIRSEQKLQRQVRDSSVNVQQCEGEIL